MNYETAYIGSAATAPKQKAAAPAQKRRTVPAVPLAKERHRRDASRPTVVSPAGDAAYGFLKTRFLPHYTGQPATAGAAEKQQFYHCLGLLCTHYAIYPADTSEMDYPYGRETALYEADRLLGEKLPLHITVDFEQTDGNFALSVTERFDTQNTLFFIPVLPLYQMMQERKSRKTSRLLLCICSYLYRVAGVPYYRNEDSYLYWNYDMLSQWVSDDPEGWGDDFDSLNAQVTAAAHIGEVMLRRLHSKAHLQNFGRWLSEYSPKDAFEKECLSLAKKFYDLRQDFPEEYIYRHADAQCLPDLEEYDDSDCITMEKYIGFIASAQGLLYYQLEQAVNNDFGECSSMQEPVLRRYFGEETQQQDSLDYECRLFPLINELCYLLNSYNYDT